MTAMTASETSRSIPGPLPFLLAKIRAQYDVLFPSALSVPVYHHRLDILQSRINAIAWILAFAMPLWSFIDALAFPDDIWTPLLTSRLLAGAAFASFLLISKIFLRRGGGNSWLIYFQIAFIFAVPTLFYIYCQLPIDSDIADRPFASAIAFSYYLVPFIVLTTLGIFPLTLLESSCFAAPLLIIYALANLYSPHLHSPISGVGALWVMASVAGISVLISISQLRLLISLITYSAYDSLTRCLSRSSGEEIIKTLWSYAQRKQQNLALAFIDLDTFKQVNDTYGHRTGDRVLAAAAMAIKKAVRESDFVIRWGGEEFLIIMSDTTMDDATTVVTRLCRGGFGKLPNSETQTASVGLAERAADDAKDSAQLIELADQRLYQAKAAGRNCCIGSKVVMLR